jgi:hypothetical protein
MFLINYWPVLIQKHRDARHLRDKRIENYNELGLVVGNEEASGNWLEDTEMFDVNITPNFVENADADADADVNLTPHFEEHDDVNLTPHFEEHAETPTLMLANEEEMSHDNASDEVLGSSEQTGARPSSSHSKQASKRRRTNDVMLQMMSVMAADIGRIADALTESNKTSCLEEVVEKVQNIPDFDDDLIIEACEYLCVDEKRGLMFLKLDERLRKKWLLRRLRG